MASPEDTILRKLNWYRLGSATSEQQWRDVVGIIAIGKDTLDYEYLREWAAHLKVADLLERVIEQATR